MRIRWHGHSCFEVSNNITIVTDPHDGRSIGINPPRVAADIVLVSHEHFDHNSVKNVATPQSKIIRESGDAEVGGVKIYGFKTYHDNARGEIRGENIVFKFITDHISLCHLGDIGEVPSNETVSKIGGVDILFIPVGGTFTADLQTCHKIVEKIKPKVVVPMHYRVGGLSLSVQTAEPFLRGFKDVKKVGNEIDIEMEDLPQTQEVWVFSL